MTDVITVGYKTDDGFGRVKQVPASTLERQEAKGFVRVEVDADGNVSEVKARKGRSVSETPDEGTESEESN